MEKIKIEKNKFFYLLAVFLVAVVLINLSACGETSQTPVQKKVNSTTKKVVKKKVNKSAKKEQDSPEKVLAYHYDPMGKKDPFKPLIKVEKKIMEKIMMKGPLTPLQKYVLTDLKIVAIIVGFGKANKAMVEDSKGDGYIISKGTLIGDKYGEVTEIKRNEVIITEKEIDPVSGSISFFLIFTSFLLISVTSPYLSPIRVPFDII